MINSIKNKFQFLAELLKACSDEGHAEEDTFICSSETAEAVKNNQ